MNTEIVTGIMGDGRIRTNAGIRLSQGNIPVRIGSSVTVLGNVVVGWNRRAGRVQGPMVPQDGNLLFLNEDYTLVMQSFGKDAKTKEIVPPGANYNA